MAKTDKEFIQNWEAWKKRGRLSYTMVVGLPFAIILAIFNIWGSNEGNDFNDVMASPSTWRTIAIYFVFGLIVYAQGMWLYNDWLYRKKLKKQSQYSE